jgi:lysozyme
MSALKLSTDGERFIQGWEKYEPKPYQDIVGVWTWGFGHARKGHEEMPTYISVADAQKLFDSDAAPFVTMANRAITRVLSQSQFDAFVSILYNVGPGAPGIKDGIIVLKSGKPSSLLAAINAGDDAKVATEWVKWDRAGGKEVQGLLNRRKAELAMFQGKKTS